MSYMIPLIAEHVHATAMNRKIFHKITVLSQGLAHDPVHWAMAKNSLYFAIVLVGV